jgi:outer membrane receptor protein involved in Fe transport
MKLDFRQRLLTTTLLVGASIVASPALAQTTPPATNTPSPPDNSATPSVPETTAPVEGQTVVPSTNAQGENVRASQDIVITGTRIPQPNLTSASPVTVLSSQEVKLQGTTRTEDLINSLPQSFASQGSNIANGSTGTATVNLRGLGSARTLVLVNGRRLQPGDPRQGSVADINFIMDTNFRGLRIDGQASTFMHDNRAGPNIIQPNLDRDFPPPNGLSVNGGAQDIAGAFGAAFDDGRGSILAYATYRTQDPVLQSTRDYSFCALGTTYTEENPFYCGGSSTSAEGVFRVTNATTGALDAFHLSGTSFLPGTTVFNFAPYNYFQRPDERYTFGAFAEYEISPGAKPYLEAMFMNDRSVSQIAPSGSFNSVTTIACDNALLSAQQLSIVCGPNASTFTGSLNGQEGVLQSRTRIARRNVEGGGRQDDLEHTAYRIVGGVRGDLLRGLSYDAYYQFGTTRLNQTYRNDFSVTRLRRATDVVLDGAGNLVCRAALTGIDTACVPYNIFAEGGVTQEALTYLQTPLMLRGHVNETIANANMTFEGGEYGLQTPWSDRGIGMNVGAEYRKESLQTVVDENFRLGEGAGQGGPTLPVAGSFDVRELFTEVQIPIVSHSFFEELTLTAGYRYSDYKVAGNHFNTDTYKVALEFAPIRDIRARASYNRAVRAPNVVELFSSVGLGLAGNNDPCAGAVVGGLVQGNTFEECARTGVTAAQFGVIPKNPANQYNALFGGNPNLSPETADTYTAGLVLQPRFIPGLAVTVDYFNIKVKDLVGTLGFSTILDQCLTSGDPFFCSKIHRDSSGSLWLDNSANVELTNTNIGGLKTKGVDLNASYAHRFGGMGTLNLSLVGTWLDELSVDTGVVPLSGGGNGVYDCAGLYGATCGTPNPEWRHKFRVGFTLPNGLGISGQWRYFSKVLNDTTSNDPDVPAGSEAPSDFKMPSQSYFDLALTARLADRYNFRLGANNIFDKEPPVASGSVVGPPFGNGNTYPQVYDALGRYLFAGVTIDF